MNNRLTIQENENIQYTPSISDKSDKSIFQSEMDNGSEGQENEGFQRSPSDLKKNKVSIREVDKKHNMS